MNEKYIVYFLSKTKKKMSNFIEAKLEANAIYDLVPSYGNILTVLYDHDGKLSMKEIGDLLGKEKSTITTLVGKLEVQGYVKKTKSETDKRMTFVELTQKSYQIEGKFHLISEEVQKTAYHNFTDEEKQTLLRLLKKLNTNFDE